ncbi:carbohydrate ABC transporter permease [Streptomyces cavernicola]|uniref:Sugar ABC transporter permease n=1 Tax=Streptomyces cavernicola TaxID=3043613 RepID=A0ABT6S5J7_9ACTN|nr:sugar ABC transporter permease [Streptomyces sp. B-S-A6]MDI3403368.1 sugar ABC transporter permease [Streptomyces sp. B-S-A6]
MSTTTTRTPERRGTPAPAGGAGRARSGQQRKQTTAAWVLLAPFLAVFAFTFVLPIATAVGQSFTTTTRQGLFGEEGIQVAFAGWDNYVQALSGGGFLTSFGRVLLFGIVQVPVMIAFCTVLALLLESASAKCPQFFRTAYFLPYGVPGVIATILWSFLYVPGLSPLLDVAGLVGIELDFLGADSVLWSIANIVTWTYTGYNMLIVIAQLKSIPGEIYEAARVDGAGAFRIAWSIQLPLIRPAVNLATVFSIIGTLQLFAEPLVLANASPAIDTEYTPNLAAYTNAFAYNEYGLASAQAVLIALVAFVLSFAFMLATHRTSRPERKARK